MSDERLKELREEALRLRSHNLGYIALVNVKETLELLDEIDRLKSALAERNDEEAAGAAFRKEYGL